jgi:hypothetical protein
MLVADPAPRVRFVGNGFGNRTRCNRCEQARPSETACTAERGRPAGMRLGVSRETATGSLINHRPTSPNGAHHLTTSCATCESHARGRSRGNRLPPTQKSFASAVRVIGTLPSSVRWRTPSIAAARTTSSVNGHTHLAIVQRGCVLAQQRPSHWSQYWGDRRHRSPFSMVTEDLSGTSTPPNGHGSVARHGASSRVALASE